MNFNCIACGDVLSPDEVAVYMLRRELDDPQTGRPLAVLPFGYAHTDCEDEAHDMGYRRRDEGVISELETKRTGER